MKSITVAVSGWRDFCDDAAVFRWLDRFHAVTPFVRLLHGAARGADNIADAWAKARGVPFQRFHADWNKHKLRAGPIRNRQILDVGRPDLVIAFPGNRGTADMLAACQERHVPSVRVGTFLRVESSAGVGVYACANGCIHAEVGSTGGVRPAVASERISSVLSRLPAPMWQFELFEQATFSADLADNPWASAWGSSIFLPPCRRSGT